jgi:1,4-alpha-glucan branching enzyme
VDPIVVIANMTPVPRSGYRVPMPKAGSWVERINTDAGWYSGSNTGNQGKVIAREVEGEHWPAYADVFLPPLATLFLKYDSA